MQDRFNLVRFVEAQQHVFPGVLAELGRGRKTGHWIWYIFPQIAGLGRTEISRYYAIASRDEARAYFEHPVLGARLIRCTELVLATEGRSADQVFGSLDAMKFRSCMTLFRQSECDTDVFETALDRFFDGEPDPLTVRALDDS